MDLDLLIMDLSKGMGGFQKQGMGMGEFQRGKVVGHESDSITNTISHDNAYCHASSFQKQVKGMGGCQSQSQEMGMAVGQSQGQYHERVEDNAYCHSSSFQKQVTRMGEFPKQWLSLWLWIMRGWMIMYIVMLPLTSHSLTILVVFLWTML